MPPRSRRLLSDLRPHLRARENAEATRNVTEHGTEAQWDCVQKIPPASVASTEPGETVQIADSTLLLMCIDALEVEALPVKDPKAKRMVAKALEEIERATERIA